MNKHRDILRLASICFGLVLLTYVHCLLANSKTQLETVDSIV